MNAIFFLFASSCYIIVTRCAVKGGTLESIVKLTSGCVDCFSVLEAASCNVGMAVETWQRCDLNDSLPTPVTSRSLIIWVPCFPSTVGLYCYEELESDCVSPLISHSFILVCACAFSNN